MVLISFYLATAKDPGNVTQDPYNPIPFLELLQKFNATELCPDC